MDHVWLRILNLKVRNYKKKKKEKGVNIQDKQSSLLEDFIFLRIF